MVAAAALVGACTLAPAPAPEAAAGRGSEGARLFLRFCSSCHGERGDGRGLAQSVLVTPPRDFTTDDARDHLSREYMLAIVRDGRPHTAMVGRTERLSHAQIEAVVDFVRAAFVPPPPGTVLARGREVWRRDCAACHGDRGQGRAAAPGRGAAPALAANRSDLTSAQMIAATVRRPHVPGAPTAAPALSALAGTDVEAVVDYVRSAFVELAPAPRP